MLQCGTLPGNAGAFVLRLQATDADVGENTVITFTHLTGGDNRFEVDTETGVIRVTTMGVDREVAGSYMLTVRAMDNGGRLVSDLEKLYMIFMCPLLQSNTETVSITILDCNDNPPLFTNPPYEVIIDEHTAMGTVVLQMLYSDADVHTTNFGTAQFIFDGGAGEQFGHFVISTSVSLQIVIILMYD